MHWGRNHTRREEAPPPKAKREPLRAANAVAAVGTAMCVVFLCAAVGGDGESVSYPAASSAAAVDAFLTQHTAFADAVGINDYFPRSAVSAGAFSHRGEDAYRDFVKEAETEWTFGEYLRDAFRTLLGKP